MNLGNMYCTTHDIVCVSVSNIIYYILQIFEYSR